ncbi:hypothetical protein HYV31_02460 [candidate division WWE3 bacterium]|nr:hypothetical protein [candidate division WWE3 bacterium]
MKRNTFQQNKTKSNIKNESLTEDELVVKLKKNLSIFLIILAVLVVAFGFFGPKVGSLFFIFSKHRNDKELGDIVPPATPIFSQIPEATNKNTITFNGVTEPDVAVSIFVNGPERQKTTTDKDGSFTFADIKLDLGQNIIFAKAKDNSGNESDKSKIYYVVFDEKKPEIKINEPKEGSVVKNLNKRVLVKGEINETAEVKVNGLNALVKSDNTFEIVLGVDSGEVEIKIQAIDAAGNKGEKTIKVTYQKSS